MSDDTVRLFFPQSPTLVAAPLPPAVVNRKPPTALKRARPVETELLVSKKERKISNAHELFARTLREFFVDHEQHGPGESKKLVDLLLTKHESYLQVLLSTPPTSASSTSPPVAPDNDDNELRPVLDDMLNGALLFVPKPELESKRALPAHLPEWRHLSLLGGRPFGVDSPTAPTQRTGNCFRARWKLSCRELATCADASPIEQQVYGLLGGLAVGTGQVLLASLLRAELEHWSDTVLRAHHVEAGEVILGRTRGEATPREDLLLVESHGPVQSVQSIFHQVLEGVTGAQRQFYLLEQAVLSGELESFLEGELLSEQLDVEFARVLVHVALYFYVNTSRHELLLPQQTVVSSKVREGLIARYLLLLAASSSSDNGITPKEMLPYVFCIKQNPQLRLPMYVKCLEDLTKQGNSDEERTQFLLELLPIANQFTEAELVVQVLVEFAQLGFEQFRWLVLLAKLQPKVELIQDALLYAGNYLLARQTNDQEAERIVQQVVSVLKTASNFEFETWSELLTARKLLSKLESKLTQTAQNIQRADLLLARTRDVERKRLVQQREVEAEAEELELLQSVQQGMQSLAKLLSAQNRTFQDEVALCKRNSMVGELIVKAFDLAGKCAEQIDLLWKTVHSQTNRMDFLWGEQVIAMTGPLAVECSQRMLVRDAGENEFKSQIAKVLQLVQLGAFQLLAQVDTPLKTHLV
ncbi:hypothetical protein BASA81_015617 [Batrachochytrium salamandrivorans]|nr:hypothetical protein BASA81_015617 [Batrachochytrium salamandrivorans]